MNKVCKTCGGYDICIIGHAGRTAECPEWRPGASDPMTNADRIRAMSDEELADYFAEVGSEVNNGTIYSDRPEDWFEWLKQPAEEEE